MLGDRWNVLGNCMADRLDAIGGALHVVSRRGEGTTIEGEIPTPTSSQPEITDAVPRPG
jgi:hypothetical protein